MTATERRYSGRSDKIVGMESVELYGSTFELLSFNAALEADPPILSDYQIVTIFVTREEIDELIQKNLFVKPDRGKWNQEIEAQMLSALVAVRKAMQQFPINHSLSFHSSIAKAQSFSANQNRFTDTFAEYGELDSFHVSGKTKTAIREEIMAEFKQSDRALVSNARCLSEGVDVPDIDCVLFADPKRSTVDIVQAVGRALRPTPDGSMSYIVVPVEIEDIDDEVQLQEAVFGSVLNILRALASNDERIVEYFRTVAAGKRWAGGSIPFEIVLPESVRIHAEDFVRSIELQCWEKLSKLSWRPFVEARKFARSLELKNVLEWHLYCSKHFPKLPPRPPDIPSDPKYTFKGQGWKNYADWLGYKPHRRGKWRPFLDARMFAQSLGLSSTKEWFDYTSGRVPRSSPKPDDIPVNPRVVYLNHGWVDWGNFLGTNFKSTRYRTKVPFDEAREFARSLGLKKRQDWYDYTKGKLSDLPAKPDDIPNRPHSAYEDEGWAGFPDFLGSGRLDGRSIKYLPFGPARVFARSLKLKTQSDWKKYSAGKLPLLPKKPENIPSGPDFTYRGNGWGGYADWLGLVGAKRTTGKLNPRWRSYDAAKEFAQTLQLRTGVDWKKFLKGEYPDKFPKPNDIPASPQKIYRGLGWEGWKEFLNPGGRWRPYANARIFVQSLGLQSFAEWVEYCRGNIEGLPEKPVDIPARPMFVYANSGWIGTHDWLGTEQGWRGYTEAREFVHSLGLEKAIQWRAYVRGHFPDLPVRPNDIPAVPVKIYKDAGWVGWPDWLGTASPRQDKHS